jgi:hypothetical protein
MSTNYYNKVFESAQKKYLNALKTERDTARFDMTSGQETNIEPT